MILREFFNSWYVLKTIGCITDRILKRAVLEAIDLSVYRVAHSPGKHVEGELNKGLLQQNCSAH